MQLLYIQFDCGKQLGSEGLLTPGCLGRKLSVDECYYTLLECFEQLLQCVFK